MTTTTQTRAVAIIARGACSPLGEGAAAVCAGYIGEAAATRVAHDEELSAAGLARPFVARARIVVPESVDRATAFLEHALAECSRDLDDVLPGWRSMRVGAAIGTSSGGMRSFERLFGKANEAAAAPRDVSSPGGDPRPRTPSSGGRVPSPLYIGPLVDAARPCAFEPVSLVLGACASSAIAIGIGRAWILDDRCDVALCGGVDAVSVFVAAGFECLRATCGPQGPRPFREGRDGLALGEGAAIVALVRDTERSQGELERRSPSNVTTARRARAWVTGFGASCDATHLTAPDASGGGLARAVKSALLDAGQPTIELVSAHGTATRQNDAAEAAALRAVLHPADGASDVPVFSFKGTIGHTLGAAGALEVLAVIDAMDREVAPATVGEGTAEAGVALLDRAARSSAQTALKLSAAFGGSNAALVVSVAQPPSGRGEPKMRSRQHVHVSSAVAATLVDTDPTRLAARTGYGLDRIARADDLVRLAMAVTAALEDANGVAGSLRGAGIVVGHGLATIETNLRFLSRIASAGAARAEPRRFPYTTPNAAAGECAVAFGLTGPSFAVGGGPHGGIEAIGVAADLVRSGVIDRVVVIAVDEAGEASERIAPGTASGAVALLVGLPGRAGRAVARLEGHTVRFEASTNVPARLPPMEAHRALLPLVGARPDEITAEVPWGGFAKARFFWL